MSAVKRSAFSVFKGKEKTKKTLEFSDSSSVASNEELAKLKGIKRRRSECSDENPMFNTPKSTVSSSKQSLKSEQRFSSIRKSIRKKVKRETHHEVELKQGHREKPASAMLQVLDRNSCDWTESMQDLNSSSLEKAFLPEVAKQKKEQSALHIEEIKSIIKPAEERFSNDMISEKPPAPLKKHKMSPKSISGSMKSLKSVDSLRNKTGEGLFDWIIAPVKNDQFFSDVWQKKPLFIKRRQPHYNNHWFSTKEFDNILRKKNVQFTKNLDIAVYRNNKRETLNPAGRAFSPIVWKFYEEGCSARLLNPQIFSTNVWELLSKLQEFFGCFVGSNVYLTPPNSQGFAPHYDDIEAFIIQLEGEKHWKLYAARDADEVLPRYSSKNMTEEELGEPILDRVLQPGDTLYFPRGIIHQATTTGDSHSLHLTLSVYQKNCWSDFMEKLIPAALQTAIEEDVEFRKALPIGYQNHVGVSNSDKVCESRKSFMKTVQQLMKKLCSHVSIDQAADELILDQMDEYLPPSLTQEERQCTIYGNGAFWDEGGVRGKSELTIYTEVLMTRPGIARLVPTENEILIHHTLENSRQYKEFPMQSIPLPIEHADIAEYFVTSHEYVRIKDAPSEDDELKLSVANQLYSCGLLRTKVALVQDSKL